MDGHAHIEAGFLAAAAIGLAAALGRVTSTRLRIPLPAILLLTGLILGRDGLNVVRTDELSDWAPLAIALAVALIVFEGGTGIDARSLRRLAPVVRNLVIGGLIVTPIVGMLSAHFLLDFPWRVAALFGALVAVTGPSVINPLLRTVRVNDQLRSVLIAEGVIIDPFGALLTFFLLQVALADSFDPSGPIGWVVVRVGIGVACGVIGSAVLLGITRLVKRLQAREVSLLVIGAAVATFGIAESFGEESGLTAMVILGITVGTVAIPHREEVEHFQESIVAFLVATVYIMLAASIPLSSIGDLWPRGFIVVLALVAIGRPLLVAIASARSDLTWRERVFLSAVAPRGVVAASLASVVAIEASGRLGANEEQFVALVFVTILATIAVQSLYAAPIARLLKVYPVRTVVAGYGEVGSRIARRLRDTGSTVLVVENDDEHAVRGRDDGFEVLFGDIASQDVLRKARIDDVEALILTTSSDERNLLASQIAKGLGCERVIAAVRDPGTMPGFDNAGVQAVSLQAAVADEIVTLAGGSPLSDVMLSPGEEVSILRFRVTNAAARGKLSTIPGLNGALVVLVRRGTQTIIPTGNTEIRFGDIVTVVSPNSAADRVRAALGVPEAMLSDL
ncbi:MAG: cation:proton antiporter [Dehalococcoidia bacterium]